MTEIRPFRASVVRPEWAARVVSPMHDSLTPEERSEIKSANPDSFLHVTRRAGDPGESHDPEVAASEGTAALERLLSMDAFRELPEPSLFVYRIGSDGTGHTGIVAEVPVASFERGDVRVHEDVQPDRVEALTRFMEGLPAISDPVALLFMSDPEVVRIIDEVAGSEPLLRVALDPDVTQTVWRVTDPASVSAIAARLASTVTYVADGHHRVAASIAVSKRLEDPSDAAVLCVLYPADQLSVLAFHRLVVGSVDGDELRRGLAQTGFTVEATSEPRPGPGSFAIRVGGRWWRATPGSPRPPGVAGLDVTRLHAELLQPLLNVADVVDPRLEVIPDTVTIADLAMRADRDGGALFLLHPPSVAELVEVADRGEVVVPKSTYFLPKPCSGVFLRPSEPTSQ